MGASETRIRSSAVSEAWDPKRYDEIIVSTLPPDVSKWLR